MYILILCLHILLSVDINTYYWFWHAQCSFLTYLYPCVGKQKFLLRNKSVVSSLFCLIIFLFLGEILLFSEQ